MSKIKKVHRIEGAAFKRVKVFSDKFDEIKKIHDDSHDALEGAHNALWEAISKELGISDDDNLNLAINDSYEGAGLYIVEEREEEETKKVPTPEQIKKIREGTLTVEDLPKDMPEVLKNILVSLVTINSRKKAA